MYKVAHYVLMFILDASLANCALALVWEFLFFFLHLSIIIHTYSEKTSNLFFFCLHAAVSLRYPNAPHTECNYLSRISTLCIPRYTRNTYILFILSRATPMCIIFNWTSALSRSVYLFYDAQTHLLHVMYVHCSQ